MAKIVVEQEIENCGSRVAAKTLTQEMLAPRRSNRKEVKSSSGTRGFNPIFTTGHDCGHCTMELGADESKISHREDVKQQRMPGKGAQNDNKKRVRKRVLAGRQDNPLLMPLGSLSDRPSKTEGSRAKMRAIGGLGLKMDGREMHEDVIPVSTKPKEKVDKTFRQESIGNVVETKHINPTIKPNATGRRNTEFEDAPTTSLGVENQATLPDSGTRETSISSTRATRMLPRMADRRYIHNKVCEKDLDITGSTTAEPTQRRESQPNMETTLGEDYISGKVQSESLRNRPKRKPHSGVVEKYCSNVEVHDVFKSSISTKEATSKDEGNGKTCDDFSSDFIQTRASQHRSTQPDSDDEPAASSSDGMSDFIVNDSYLSEEDSMTITPPPPRSTRRLVRGRKPQSQKNSNAKKDKINFVVSGTQPSIRGSLTITQEQESIEIADTELDYSQLDRKSAVRDNQQKLAQTHELGSAFEGLSLNEDFERIPSQPVDHKRTITPPTSPLQRPIKLKSPTKKSSTIPTSPHKPTMDSFWDQEAVNAWNDEYSPQKILKQVALDDSPVKSGLLFPPKKSPAKQNKEMRDARKMFEATKHEIANSFLAELDGAITHGQISQLASETGGIQIIWSNKLNTTAGRANWRRETIKTSTETGAITVFHRHHATIELASKVISSKHRLLNVLAHEFCHLANFMISNVKTNPHGKEFKAWAAKCSHVFGNRGIEVTTKHAYEIDYKYIWECESCGLEFKRHSKSIDPAKHRCGSCKATLMQTIPVPRGGRNTGDETKKITDYQLFVKENMTKVRDENPGSPQKELMGLVARRYKESKVTSSTRDQASMRDEGGISKEGTHCADDINLISRQLKTLDLIL